MQRYLEDYSMEGKKCSDILEENKMWTVFDVCDWLELQINECEDLEAKNRYFQVKSSLQSEIASIIRKYDS